MSIRFQSSQRELSGIHSDVIKILQEVSATLVGTFDLDVLLQKIVETYQKISKASTCSIFLVNIEIQKDFLKQEVIPRLKVDLDAMKMVFLNLLVNTRNVRPINSKVKILTKLPSDLEMEKCGIKVRGNFIKIVYEDNGGGIPDEEKERIFEPFFTHNPASSGLGLTIIRRIIEQQGGKIFEDGRYGHGARFNIILPVVV